MSIQAAWTFANETLENHDLSARLTALTQGRAGREAAEAVAGLAAEHGYDCTADEVTRVQAELRSMIDADGELDDADLAGVSGGVLNIMHTVFRNAQKELNEGIAYWTGS